jgi:flagellar M-ring protein FliF
LGQIFNNLLSLGKKRLLLLGATFAGVMAALLFAVFFILAPSYRPMATDLSSSEAAEMVAALERGGFSPKISQDGTLISLPENDIARARMLLAEDGLATAGPSGWEIFDNSSAIGMNSFMQRINRARALEGELVRSIQTLEAVESARVHLVLPEREAFSQERPEATASVIIRPRRGMDLDRKQAVAIRNMVAAAVPSLSVDNVSIMSSNGALILTDEGQPAGGDKAQLEERLARNIENILTARVGAGNVRVRVAADIATTEERMVRQSYNPDEQVARSIASDNQESQSTGGRADGVDVGNNIPFETNGSAGGTGGESSRRTSEETNFEIGNTRTEVITPAGGIRRLTIAVLVNGTYENGTYTERGSEELARLTALARSASGVNEERGDIVTVESLQFVDTMGDSGAGRGLLDLLRDNFNTILRSILGLTALVLILWFAIRPIIARIAAENEQSDQAMIETLRAAGNLEASPETTAQGAAAAGAGETEDPDEDYLAVQSVQGGIMRRYVEEVHRLIESEPDASLNTIRLWINQKS